MDKDLSVVLSVEPLAKLLRRPSVPHPLPSPRGRRASLTLSRRERVAKGRVRALRGARFFAYLHGMSQSLRAVRLVSSLPHDILKEAPLFVEIILM